MKNRSKTFCPASSHIANCIASAAQKHQRQIVLFHELHALGVAFNGHVKAAQSVSGQGIGSALQHHGGGLVGFHDFGHDGYKSVLVTLIIDTVAHGEIDSVVLSATGSDIL